jgi:hypothetical protein
VTHPEIKFIRFSFYFLKKSTNIILSLLLRKLLINVVIGRFSILLMLSKLAENLKKFRRFFNSNITADG